MRDRGRHEHVEPPGDLLALSLPYNLAIDGAMIALLFARSGRANVAMLAVLILLITIPYWDAGNDQGSDCAAFPLQLGEVVARPDGSRLTHLC